MLDEDVTPAAVRRVAVPCAEQLGRTSWLATEEVDGGEEQLAEPVGLAEVVGNRGRTEPQLARSSSSGLAVVGKLGRFGSRAR